MKNEVKFKIQVLRWGKMENYNFTKTASQIFLNFFNAMTFTTPQF